MKLRLLDHIVPVSTGGKTSIDNLQILCPKCNRGKDVWANLEYVAHCQRVVMFHERG